MELSVRLFALSSNWFRLLYTDPGNAFDALILCLSVTSLYLQETGQQAHPIKMLGFVKVLTFGVSFFGTEHPSRYADLKTALLTTVQVATCDLRLSSKFSSATKEDL